MKFLEATLRPDDVLLTHHFPLRQSIAPAYASSALNPFFWAGADAEELVLKHMPRLVIHGHTHDCMSYEVGSMRIECNPHGYPSENLAFDFCRIVET
jgi:Icc-related predicted phosphoesterase